MQKNYVQLLFTNYTDNNSSSWWDHWHTFPSERWTVFGDGLGCYSGPCNGVRNELVCGNRDSYEHERVYNFHDDFPTVVAGTTVVIPFDYDHEQTWTCSVPSSGTTYIDGKEFTAGDTIRVCGNCGTPVAFVKKATTTATPPTAATGLIYNANTQTGVPAGTGYTITGNTGKDAGDYTAIARLEDGYTWTDGSTDGKTIEWSIAPAELTSLGVTKTLFFYNGNVQKPEVTEVRAGSLIVPDTDYSLSWSNEQSTDVGFYTVEATATTNNFTGSATVTYEISDGIAKIPTAKTGIVYNGTMQTGVEPGTGYILWDNTGLNAGKYTATATLEEGFEWNDGSKDPKTIDWSIARAPITDMSLSQTSFSYDGSVQKPRIKSVFAGPLQLEIGDYTLAWSDENSKEIGVYTVTVRGTYNFTGVQTRKYAIESMETWNLFEAGMRRIR